MYFVCRISQGYNFVKGFISSPCCPLLDIRNPSFLDALVKSPISCHCQRSESYALQFIEITILLRYCVPRNDKIGDFLQDRHPSRFKLASLILRILKASCLALFVPGIFSIPIKVIITKRRTKPLRGGLLYPSLVWPR